MHVSPSTDWRTVTRLAGKWLVLPRKKKWRSSLAQNDGTSSWGVFSLLSSLLFSFSLFLFPPTPLSLSSFLCLCLSVCLSVCLSLSLSLSLSITLCLSLSLSVSLSVSLKGHTPTQKRRQVNAHPYNGPTDFASNCIHLVGWDSWIIVTVESMHNPPEAPEASPLPENRRHACRTTTNQQELEHNDDHRMQNCTQTWTPRKSSDTIPDTRDVQRPLSLTIGCWPFSLACDKDPESYAERRRTTKSMPAQEARKEETGLEVWGRPCTVDRTRASSPLSFTVVAYCMSSTPPCPTYERVPRVRARTFPGFFTTFTFF